VFKPDGIHEWDGNVVEDIEEHENVTVIVSRNMDTGAISLGWKRQPNTIDHIYAEECDDNR